MLAQRIATALVLLALLVPALWSSSPWPFQGLTLVLVAVAGWEWARLSGVAHSGAVLCGAALALACAAAAFVGWAVPAPAAVWIWAVWVWAVGGTLLLVIGPAGWQRLPAVLRLCIGLVALWVAWLAIVQAHALGVPFLLSVFALVWTADIAAYAGGRAFGRRKLAPSISPGKSWEGALSALLGVLLLAWGWTALDQLWFADGPGLFGRLRAGFGLAGMVMALVALTAFGVLGDLFESLAKRAAGVKDSSQLLPGHGGVLDRIDALIPVFPLALALAGMAGLTGMPR
ncbi:MAG: phosphatidate cytidylyltransferase [Rubrivivax sp.]